MISAGALTIPRGFSQVKMEGENIPEIGNTNPSKEKAWPVQRRRSICEVGSRRQGRKEVGNLVMKGAKVKLLNFIIHGRNIIKVLKQ